MKTLIVVDMQNDFISPLGSLTVPKGEELINPLLDLMQDADRDWHRMWGHQRLAPFQTY